MLVAAPLVAARRHAERGAQRGARVPRAVAVVLTLGPQHETVQPLVLADALDVAGPPFRGEHLVDVSLMAHVKHELVPGRVENPVQRDGQLHHAEVRPEVPAHAGGVRLAHDVDQLFAHFLRQLGEVALGQRLQVGGRLDLVEQAHGRFGDRRGLDGEGFKRG